MNPERWQRIKHLLDACADLDPSDRTTWLDEACAEDPSLRQEVESYLVHEDELSVFDEPAVDRQTLDQLAPEVDDEDEIGRRIGPYRLEALLGRGGMGAVYRARREAEFEQRVAIKLVRAGLDNPEVVERFHTERQILAGLEHPNIARLLDGGTSEGRPYFVMELIDGVPLDRYCDEHRLTIRQRVELVLPICDALAFAHRNLVLHLDLKPSNILVTRDGIPKLLDFGIGKLLGQARQRSHPPRVGSRPMTLSYASPEQLVDDPLSTSSDLYSLGVVLYELLTGRLPGQPYASDRASLAWAICHRDPSRPSTAVRRTEVVGFGERRETLTPRDVAATRESSPATLWRRLRGDLDAILLKTLAKDPLDRYDSMEQLTGDLRRHFADLPVRAREGGWLYRTGKTVRRNRWSLGFAAVVVSLVLGFTLALSNQLQVTEIQRQRSVRLSDFLVQLFRAAEPDRGAGETSVRELVDLGRERLDIELEEEPEVRASLLGTLGRVYYRLGYYGRAQEAHEASLLVLQQEVDPEHPESAKILNDLSAIAFARGEHGQAEGYARRALAARERLGVAADLIKPRNNLASILLLRGKLDEARAIYEETLAQRRLEHGGDLHRNVATSLRSLARVHFLAGDLDIAEPLFERSLEIRVATLGHDSTGVASALASLGQLAHARGDLDHAESFYLEALAIRERLLEDDHLTLAILRVDLARLMLDRDELDTARALLERSFGPIYHHKPEGDWIRGDLESVYGAYLAARGRLEEAEVCLEEGYRTIEAVRGPEVLPSREARQRLEVFRVRTSSAASAPPVVPATDNQD